MLRQAAGDGRIDLDELDERLEATYAAKTYGELVPITVDLPVPAGPCPPPARRDAGPGRPAADRARYSGSVAVMSETKRVGPWVVEDNHTAFALMGSVVLDLRQAQFETREVTINAHAVMGEVQGRRRRRHDGRGRGHGRDGGVHRAAARGCRSTPSRAVPSCG